MRVLRELPSSILAAVSLLLTSLSTVGAQEPPPLYDVIVRGGTLVDGSGGAAYEADLAIAGSAIARIGDLSGVRAAVDIDARGLLVAPGFINIHSHATAAGLVRAENMLLQGVTTEILNADGGGPLDVAEQLQRLSDEGLAVHVGVAIGFNRIWAEVVGPDDRRPTPREIEHMRSLLVDGLASGAFGVSAGLDYKPAYFATTDEVVAIVQAAAPWHTYFTNHERLTPETGYSSRVGIAETLEIGRRAGLAPIVTHMKAQGREQGTGQALIDLIAAASGPGRLAAADVYPYLAGQSGLGALIVPGWAQEGGRERMLERFRDPVLREKIVLEAEEAMRARFGGPEGVYVLGLDEELVELMAEMGDVSAGEALVRALEASSYGAILRFGAERDLVAILRGPTSSVACDCGAVAEPASHPRYFGTFPRVLGRYVREEKALSWEEAVRKMTGLPAATVGLVDRGLLAPGMAADVAIFDPETIRDRATFDDPNAPPQGVRHVLVGGRFALRDGTVTGARGGRVLRRSRYMPSRPMNADSEGRELRVDGSDIFIEARQPAGARRAEGQLRVRVRRSEAPIETDALGVLQTMDRWASLTATATLDGRTEPLLVIADSGGESSNGTTTVVVRIGGTTRVHRLAGARP